MASLARSKIAVWIARHLLPSGLTLVAVLLLLGYAFVFRQQVAAIKDADRVAALTQEYQSKEAYLKQLDDLSGQYAGFDPEDVSRIRNMIPSDEDVPGILAMLEASANASDVQLTAVNFAASDTTGLPGIKGVSAVNVSISLQHGDYARFKLFLDALESNLRLFDVRSASINPSAATYSLTIRTYIWGKLTS